LKKPIPSYSMVLIESGEVMCLEESLVESTMLWCFLINDINSVSVDVSFFQLKWNVLVLECFSMPFRGCIVHIYIYIYIYIYKTNIIQIQDKLIINYAIQTQCQTNIILKFKIFLNSQD